jgi:hypothetical protein
MQLKQDLQIFIINAKLQPEVYKLPAEVTKNPFLTACNDDTNFFVFCFSSLLSK